MARKKKYIKYTKERVVLSDVLPYESPIIFSNRYFYRFLVNNKIQLLGDMLLFENEHKSSNELVFVELLKLLFDFKDIPVGQKFVKFKETKRIPFNYKIAHKESDFRELTIIHPMNQIALIDFYERYKELILYYSRVSPFSIRKPDSVAKFVFFNDKLHEGNMGEKDDFLELRGKEYENLKSFFTYKKYTNIYRFYEDYRYQRAEKKFKILYKFDITKCFDSIYSHSIVWALMNKEIVKDKVRQSESTFGGRFDKLIQNANYGETHGIVIGPEFSRIFAEIILQQVDKSVEQRLRNDHSFYHRKDYEVYRYVDDYFLFCDTEAIKNCIIKLFKHELKDFKMALNDSKAKSYTRPMITEISIAKQKINQLFEKEPLFKILEKDKMDKMELESSDDIYIIDKHVFKLYINPNKLASKFKTIIKESQVEYKDVLNYTLAILNNKIENILERFETKYVEYCRLEKEGKLLELDLGRKKKLESTFTKFIIGYIDFVFFLYSVSPRVNSTIKLANILSKIINYYKGSYKISDIDEGYIRFHRIQQMNRDIVFKKISDDISLILERHQIDSHTQIEALYLLIILRDLGKNHRIAQNLLAKYFNCITKESSEINISNDSKFNYFTITVILFYIRNVPLYKELKEELKRYIIECVSSIDTDKRKKKTEFSLLIMDLLVCPFVDYSFKEKLLKLYMVPDSLISGVIGFRKYQKYWFVKWENFDLAKELNTKTSEEVYS